jgi:O-antigen/teichoic acid export membrane protein
MSVIINYFYNLLYQILLIIMPLITIPYVSRVIGAEGLGIYSYTNSIANYFVLFAMLGLNNYGNRSIAKVRADKKELSHTFWSIYITQFVAAISVVLLYVLYLNVSKSTNSNIATIQLLFVCSSLFDINWFFFGIEKFKLTVSRNILIKLLTVLFIFLFVKTADDLNIYTTILSGSILLNQIVLWGYLRKYVVWVRPAISDIIGHIRPNLILFIPVISVSLYKVMDKVMIGMLSDMFQLGYYENAEKINSVQISISTALGTVMLPRMTNILVSGDNRRFQSVLRKSMQFVMFLSFALCFGIIAVASDFVPLFMGKEFIPSSAIILILAPIGIIISWANVIRTQFLIPNSKDKIYIFSVILGAIINLFLNLLLINKYGGLGAAIATLATEFIVMLYQTIKCRKYIDIKQFLLDNFIFLFIGIFMFIVVKLTGLLFEREIISLIMQIGIGTFTYILLAFIYFYFFQKEKFLEYMSIIPK